MIGPSSRLAAAVLLAAIPFVVEAWIPGPGKVGVLALAGLGAVVALDLAIVPRRDAFEVGIFVDPVLSLAEEGTVSVRVKNRSGAAGTGWARVVLPEPWAVARLLEPFRFSSRGEGEAVFRATPRKRGRYVVGPVFLRLPSPLGFLWRDLRYESSSEVKVFPGVGSVRKYDLLCRRLHTREPGLHSVRVRGQGMEFSRLREHHPDDDLRIIDWKATARRGRFISREYQVERCQNVVLMIDAGRMLTEEVDGIVKIEYVLNAAILLARVAASYDDRVGALVFSDRMERMSALHKGHAAVSAMAEALYDVQPKLVEADYEMAFAEVGTRFRKRALLVLFTNLVDQGTSDLVSGYLKAAARRHVPLCVAVGDRETRDAAWALPRTEDEAYRKAAAAHLLFHRARTLQELQRRGVHVIDAPAGRVSVEVINKYLDLKARQAL